ncbi:FtsX-like permease family protein [Natronosporangium hydrolyticum]|uniref:FtsX-like permease family protein n=1 Tax=Natronosporangium hydrolyticum TaxID=2811111 RepID=A0A895YB69_9ACTN|nr:FtsX-like permease family protein [Natronosporangium hydrolyticum]QSB12713.1 FtsX-like permease family protein [Natronosporangium hydrolyticum]
MLRTTLRSMLHRKLRLLLSGLAVILGVMFVAGSLILTDTLGRSFDTIFADAYAETDVLVQGEAAIQVSELEGEQVPANIPADTADTVAAVSGVAQAVGLVEADGARVIGSDGKVVSSFGPPRLGINWTADAGPYELREGRGPAAPDEIAIDVALADSAGLAIGDEVGVLTREPRNDFTLVGTFGFAGGRDTLGGVQFVAFTDEVAQQLMLGETGVWNAVDVQAEPGVAPETLRDDIAAALGDGYEVRTGEQAAADQADELKEGLAFFNYILLGFAGVALFVGVFLILNTFSIIVAQRTRELALARAIGASRRQMIGSVMLEATVVGAVASVLGLAAGVGVGWLLARVAAAFSELPLAGLGVPATAVIAAVTVGLLVTLVAAVLPALRASRVPPVAAMQEAATPDRPLTKLSVVGGAILVTGAGILMLGLTDNAGGAVLAAILGGVLLTFIGTALLTPLVARPVIAVLGRLFSWSLPGRLGRLNSARNPRRTAITAAALMVGVSLVAGIGVLLTSAKASMETLARDSIAAELIIAGEQTGPRPPSFDAAVLPAAAELPGVHRAAGIYQELALIDGERTFLTAADDLAALRDVLGLESADGTLTTLAPGQTVVDEQRAETLGLAVGDQVEVQLSQGESAQYELVGLYQDSPIQGGFILPVEATPQFAVPQPTIGLIQLADGVAGDELEPAVSALLADSPEVSVSDQSAFIEQQTSQLDTIFVMIQVLLGLAILIAVLGVINTLALSVIERTRELGLLRAVGLNRAATMRMVTVEAVVISLFGAVLGIALGVALGAAAVQALRDQGISQFAVPWSDLGVYLVLAALVGVIAAVLPAIRAARINVLRAIAHE